MHQPLSLSWLRESQSVPQHSLIPRKSLICCICPHAGLPVRALDSTGAGAGMTAAADPAGGQAPPGCLGAGRVVPAGASSDEGRAAMTWTTLLTFASAGQHECGTCDFVRPGAFQNGI